MKKSFLLSAAALLLAVTTIFSACSNKGGADMTAAPTEAAATIAPTAEPTPEPTAAVPDYSAFDIPLGNICRFIEEPNVENLSKLFPSDLFLGLKSIMESALEAAGLGFEHFGYSDFAGFMEGMLKDLDFTGYVGTQGIEDVEKADYVINSCEPAEVSFIIERLKDFTDYLDPEKITSAYKLETDFIFEGEGQTAHNDAELWLYEYDGEFYVLFADNM